MKTIFFITLTVLSIPLFAQDEYDTTSFDETIPDTVTMPLHRPVPGDLKSAQDYQSGQVTVRKFNEEDWKKIVGDTNFFEEQPEPQAPRKRVRWGAWSNAGVRIVSYALMIALIIFIIYYVLRNQAAGRVRARTVVQTDLPPEPDESMEMEDLDTLLVKATNDANWRLVIRIHYLKLLKKLDEKELIKWKKDKTNLDYLSELFSRNYFYEEVRTLTLAYEIVWYGEKTISRQPYEQMIRDFEAMHERINATGTNEE